MITLTQTEYKLKEGTSTVYEQTELNQTKTISIELYNNYTNSISYFRKLGGKETITKNNEGKITKLISISPNKETKIIREFKF